LRREPTSTTSPRPAGDEEDPAKDEGPHQELAELRVGDDQPPQSRGRDVQQLPIGSHAPGHQGTASGEEVDLPGELAWLAGDDELFAIEAGPDDVQLSLHHDEEVNVLVSLPVDLFSGTNLPAGSVGGYSGQLRWSHPRGRGSPGGPAECPGRRR
jgi:hypothetical protein